MYASDINSSNLVDQYPHPNLFNLNETQNIWSTNDKSYISSETFLQHMRSRNIFNSSNFIGQASIIDKPVKPRKAAAGERRDTNLIVNYLPDGFYEKDLHDLFSKAGPIAHYHVVRNKENRSECYGFVDFEKPADAEKAIEMFHQYAIQNKKLKVQNAYEGLLIKQEEKERTEKGLTNIGYNIEIKNAPFRWTIQDVKNIFGKYGEILKVTEICGDDSIENIEIKTKTFNVVYRYQVVAAKVVKKKNKQFVEPLWPLDLEIMLVGQEYVESISEPRCRSRNSKAKFDQLSETSYDSKFSQLDPKSLIWDDKLESANKLNTEVSFWPDDPLVNSIPNPNIPLTSNGRPILKHKDQNFIFPNDQEPYGDMVLKTMDVNIRNTMEPLSSIQVKQKSLIPDSVIKNIWEYKEPKSPIPTDIFVRTPLIPYMHPTPRKGKFKANIWLKLENTQPTGSFKLRGMAFVLFKAKLDGVGLVVSSSGGNAGLAVAYVCRILKLRCTIVVPVTTPSLIVDLMTKQNAQVVQEGSNWQESHSKAELIREKYPGLSRLVHPFDDPLLWNGYETIVDEIVDDMNGKKLDLIALAVGGGGLLNGVAQGISKHNLNKQTAILTMETEGTACFNKSIFSEELLTIQPEGVATSLGASRVSQRSMDIFMGQDHHLFSMVCSDLEAVESCIKFLYENNALVEPACGTSLSAIYNGNLDEMAECRGCDLNVVVIVCGGKCTDVETLFNQRQMLLQQQERYYQQQQSAFDMNLGRLTALDINKMDGAGSGGSHLMRSQHSVVDSIVGEQQYFYQQLPALQQHSNNNNSNNKSLFSSSTYSSIASKNLGPIRDQNSKSNVLSLNHLNRNLESSTAATTNILSHSTNIFHNSMMTNAKNEINLSNSIVSTAAPGSVGAGGGSSSTTVFVPSFSSSDMVASPVGSQHSDKENRF